MILKKILSPPKLFSPLLHSAHHELLQAAKQHQEKIWGYFPSLNKPLNLFLEEIEIPPRDKEGFWALEFCASQTPHAGVEGVEGHFLAAFAKEE